MTMRSFTLTVTAALLCACASPQSNVQEAGLQNAVYVVGDNVPMRAVPVADTKDAPTDEQGSALKRLYLFFVRR